MYFQILSSTQERKSKTYIASRKQRYYVRHNQLSDDVPVAIVFKVSINKNMIYGAESIFEQFIYKIIKFLLLAFSTME